MSESTRKWPRPDILLVGCGKAKLDRPVPAEHLYTSTLFKKRRAYVSRRAEKLKVPWAIVSAKMPGIWLPNQVVAPYDLNLKALSDKQLSAWATAVHARLRHHFYFGQPYQQHTVIEVHAGRAYADALVDAVRVGFTSATISRPVDGLQIGELLKWYTDRLPDAPSPKHPVSADGEGPPVLCRYCKEPTVEVVWPRERSPWLDAPDFTCTSCERTWQNWPSGA